MLTLKEVVSLLLQVTTVREFRHKWALNRVVLAERHETHASL